MFHNQDAPADPTSDTITRPTNVGPGQHGTGSVTSNVGNDVVDLVPQGHKESQLRFNNSTPLQLVDFESVTVDPRGGVDQLRVFGTPHSDVMIFDAATLAVNGQSFGHFNTEVYSAFGNSGDDAIGIAGGLTGAVSTDGGDGRDFLSVVASGGGPVGLALPGTIIDARTITSIAVEAFALNAGSDELVVAGAPDTLSGLSITPTSASVVALEGGGRTYNLATTGTLTVAGAAPTSGSQLPLRRVDIHATVFDDTIAVSDTAVDVGGSLKPIALAGVASVRVFGEEGSDSFTVTPSATTSFFIDGGDPIGFGDSLNLIAAQVTLHPGPANDQGGCEILIARPVSFDHIETRTINGAVANDQDVDGVDNSTESQAPNNGDGNGDGVPDSQQSNVASLPNAANGKFVTLSAPPGTVLQNVVATGNPSPANAPPGVTFPVGFIGFQLLVPAGAPITVSVQLEAGSTLPTTYYKFGPEPANPAPHWYEFLFDAAACAAAPGTAACTGAEFVDSNGDGATDRIDLHFIDGQRGDSDIAANGIIVDPGAPGLPGAPAIPGDVVVALRRGELILTGDAGDNRVRIEQGAARDSLRVIGLVGTLVNGQTAPREFAGVRAGLNANLGGGNDALFLGAGTAHLVQRGLVRLNTGSGDDLVRIENATLEGRLLVNTGVGDDTVEVVDAVLAGIVTLDASDGDDRITLDDSSFRRGVRLETGLGMDALTIRGSQFTRPFIADLDSGDLTVTLIDSVLASGSRLRGRVSR